MKGIFSKILFTLSLVFCLSGIANAQFDEDAKKAMYILNFAKKITWPNEASFEKYTIGVLRDKDLFERMKSVAEKDNINGKPIEVVYFKRMSDIIYTQILFVEKMPDANGLKVWKMIENSPTLLVSDRWKERRLVMINFTGDENKLFEVNNVNIKRVNLQVSDKVLVQGGSEAEIRNIYHKSEKELKEQKEKVEQQKKEIAKQQEHLNKLNAEMNEAKKELEQKMEEIEEKQAQIEIQKLQSDTLMREINFQKQKLAANLQIVKKQENDMIEKQKEIDERVKKLKSLNKDIRNAQKKIKKQGVTITEKTDQIETQQNVLLVVGFFLAVVAVLAFIIFRGYKVKQAINKQLEEKNVAIMEQKEEIEAQARELEKLSIVASETDNAVLIMDNKGDFEWVNESFTRMFGFTLDQLVAEKSKNIIGTNTPPNVRETIMRCFNEKITVSYQFSTKKRDGELLWIQATLTPIINEEGNITKVIAIDSDVTKIKEAEFEIQQQAEELSAQADELQRMNSALEKEREMTMGSIRYGLTIQQAILPLKREMDKYFESFIIYKPKDVVSGDFYWFSHVPAKGIIPAKTYVAAVDCTGHGVPGAFMSMIGSRLLNEIVNEKDIYQPSQILDTLNKGVIKALRQDTTDNNDGMDLSLCLIERQNENEIRITYAGAKRPLYYCHNGTTEIKILDGTRKSIGGARATRNTSKFSDQYLTLQETDTLYLSTDGMIDQNAPNRKRFGSKRFLRILEECVKLPLEEQKAILEYEFDKYRQNQPQRDDVTLIGVKV